MILRRWLVFILALTLGLGGCPLEAFAAQQADSAAAVDTSPAALDHLLAPIALYPDALLMQVLAASVDSQEVLDAGNWLLENKSLEGTQIDAAAKKLGFGAAMIALLHFPDVVDLMCTQLDWTRDLGAAFSADQAAVLDSVQRLRAQAVQYGNLQSTPQQQVVTQTDNGKQVIVIQPANPQVVYVPQYDPETVYVSSPGPSAGDVVAASVISFGVGMAIGSLFSNNNYYYPRWGYGGVYYGGRPWSPVHYHYRPIYGPYWRPAGYYRPPPGYPYHRPVHYNNGYWNSRPGNNNRPGYNGGNRPGYGNGNRPGGNGNGYNKPGNGYNKPGNGNNNGGNRPGNGGGDGNYPGNRPGSGNGNRPGNGGGSPAYNKPGGGGSGNGNGNGNRPGGGGWNGGTTRPASPGPVTRPAPDRGYTRPAPGGNQTRPVPGGGGQGRPAAAPQTRPAPQARPSQPQARSAPARQAPAFAAGGSGRSANAASQRGAASNGGRKR
jgi:hypothetical protein